MNDFNNLEKSFPDFPPTFFDQLQKFGKLISQYNIKLNLLSKQAINDLSSKHFYDCIQALLLIQDEIFTENTLYDFGSGNGLPGVIAGLVKPEQKIVMVERDQRKAEFLRIAIDELKLDGMQVFDKDLNQLPEDSCYKAISRAMAPLPKFLLEARKRMPAGSETFLFKGEHWSTELSSVPAQVFEYWEVDLYKSYLLPNNEGERFIIKCHRV